ncbi:iron-containing alcohol dehydrogenase [Urbifossiella limnaea]|uniref:NAD-dependent methanol dehydrogenase n=1 Tax=Urbifossiella limnaea TaxID=2528023 RepID=A0A517XP88_9BACT|nr:iron-containing alcohol dehydrogenase [Urbifossiella limnaea]QDU19315.1 NAD-dependent methanol dehydrogenase [Urbifossiella limnaea]
MRTWSFQSAGSLLFGRGAAGHLPDVARGLGAGRVFVVADPTLQKVGTLDAVVKPILAAGMMVETFLVEKPEPAVEVVRAAAAKARAAAPAVILGLGGGSNMDVAKLVSLVLAHGGDPLDYTGDCRVPGPILPTIGVPTTAGTGSEVSAAAVFGDSARQIKVSCLSPFLRPDAAVVDPLLSASCPPKVTADSGIDALTHAIEAFTAIDNDLFPLPSGEKTVYQGKNPMADVMAKEAITLVGKYLRRAVANGDDLEARDGMALAGTLGGLAFSNAGVALVHAMEYPVGGAVHVSHGAGNGLLLPFVMEFNRPAAVRTLAKLPALLGAPDADEPDEDAAVRAVAMVAKLREDIGIPTRLRDIGVTEAMLPGFAEKAFAIKRLMRVNPRTPQSAAEIEAVYRAAF